jgi:hypothetical protein
VGLIGPCPRCFVAQIAQYYTEKCPRIPAAFWNGKTLGSAASHPHPPRPCPSVPSRTKIKPANGQCAVASPANVEQGFSPSQSPNLNPASPVPPLLLLASHFMSGATDLIDLELWTRHLGFPGADAFSNMMEAGP